MPRLGNPASHIVEETTSKAPASRLPILTVTLLRTDGAPLPVRAFCVDRPHPSPGTKRLLAGHTSPPPIVSLGNEVVDGGG